MDKDSYKLFLQIQFGKIKGDKLIPEFKDDFPFANIYEVYDIRRWQKSCKCNFSAEDIQFIAQTFDNKGYYVLAEINSKIDPNYAFVYDFKEKYFIFVPLTEKQKKLLNFLYDDFNKDWVNSFLSNYNPVNFVSLKVLNYF